MFPKDENIKLAWLSNIKRPDWQPTSASVLCSKHFEASLIDKSGFRTVLAPGAIPTIFDLVQDIMPTSTITNEGQILREIQNIQHDGNKLHELSDSIVVGLNGAVGETTQFAQYLAKNVQLYKTRNRYGLSTAAVEHFARGTMMDALHRGTPNMLNVLIAGYDVDNGGQLYTMDFLGSTMLVPYASHGIGGYLGLGIIQYFYKPTLTEEEVYEVLKLCVREIHKRLFMNLANFEVKIVSKEGIGHLPSISPESLMQ
ncbi:unnamed protein product, partial [Iphiclides podalirius]